MVSRSESTILAAKILTLRNSKEESDVLVSDITQTIQVLKDELTAADDDIDNKQIAVQKAQEALQEAEGHKICLLAQKGEKAKERSSYQKALEQIEKNIENADADNELVQYLQYLPNRKLRFLATFPVTADTLPSLWKLLGLSGKRNDIKKETHAHLMQSLPLLKNLGWDENPMFEELFDDMMTDALPELTKGLQRSIHLSKESETTWACLRMKTK